MFDRDPISEVSKLSQVVTLDGVGLKVRIYRPRGQSRWMLAVIAPDNTYTFFDASFDSEAAALAAFLSTVKDEGVTAFLDRGRYRNSTLTVPRYRFSADAAVPARSIVWRMRSDEATMGFSFAL